MTPIPTIASGDTCSAVDQYNLLVAALADVLGITDTDQLWAAIDELRLKDADTILSRSGDDLQFEDVVSGVLTLTDLAGYYATPLALGQPGSGNQLQRPMLTPIRTIQTVSLLGFHLSFVASTGLTFQIGVYSDEPTMRLLAATQVTAGVNYSDMTVMLTNPCELVADRMYWILVLPTNYMWMFAFGRQEGPLFSRVSSELTGKTTTGLPQTLDFSKTSLPEYGYWDYGPVAFTLIVDGGQTYA